MLKTFKFNVLSITLLFATSSAILADSAMTTDMTVDAKMGTDYDNCKNCVTTAELKEKEQSILHKIKEAFKPGNPGKIMDNTLVKIFGKDTFSYKVASEFAPKALSICTIKVLVGTIFENSKVTVENGKLNLAKTGSWAKNEYARPLFVKDIRDNENKLTGQQESTLFANIMASHKTKDLTDGLLGAILMVWLKNK